jgi:hypothetical protein
VILLHWQAGNVIVSEKGNLPDSSNAKRQKLFAAFEVRSAVLPRTIH